MPVIRDANTNNIMLASVMRKSERGANKFVKYEPLSLAVFIKLSQLTDLDTAPSDMAYELVKVLFWLGKLLPNDQYLELLNQVTRNIDTMLDGNS